MFIFKTKVEESRHLTYSKISHTQNIHKNRRCTKLHSFVYYESIKRTLKRRLIYEYRCDERLKTKNEESTRLGVNVVYYESIKRELKRRLIYEYGYDERLKTKNQESTRLRDTGLVVELEHLKTKTRLIDEKFVSVRGECETSMR